MKKIALINASPKKKESASETIVNVLHERLKKVDNGNLQISEYTIHSAKLEEDKTFLEADSIIIAFPLYVDGIPSHLLHCLCEIEQLKQNSKSNPANLNQRVYAIVNCGFYEGRQNQNALAMIENWCEKSNFLWSGGIGIGGGGMLTMMHFKEDGKGPMHKAFQAIKALSEAIKKDKQLEIQYTTPDFPRILYILGAQMGWRQMARANGLKRSDLDKKHII